MELKIDTSNHNSAILTTTPHFVVGAFSISSAEPLSINSNLAQSYFLTILLSQWRSDVDRNIKLPNGQPLPVVLMVNKVDSTKDAASINKAELDR